MQFEADVSLGGLNTLGVVSRAEHFCRVTSDTDWLAALDYANTRSLPITILGGGSNVILRSTLSGLVVHPVGDGIELIEQTATNVVVNVGAGAEWDKLVRFCNERGWFGLENLVSIPGSSGAAPVQNIGAYGVEVAEFIERVRVLDLQTGEFALIKGQDCGFAYRYSHFKGPWRGRYAILGIHLRLSKTPRVNTNYAALAKALLAAGLNEPSPLDVLNTVAAIRAEKLPDVHVMPNAGSFFKNPIVSTEQAQSLQAQYPELPVYTLDGQSEKLAAAYLIETVGLKGCRRGGCGISEEHALVLVNPGHASGAECLALADEVINRVQSEFDVALEIEPVVMGK
jgi:UDP-N-acetylmuramate dehydrogenase